MAFSGPAVNIRDDFGDVLMTHFINIFSLWEVLSDQAVGFFVEASPPGVIGMCEEPLSSQLVGDLS